MSDKIDAQDVMTRLHNSESNSNPLYGLALAALRQQQAEIEELRAQIAKVPDLYNEIEKLQAQVERQKKIIETERAAQIEWADAFSQIEHVARQRKAARAK